MRNSKSKSVGFLADSALKFITLIDIFLNTSKTKFLNILVDSPVQCCREKANFM